MAKSRQSVVEVKPASGGKLMAGLSSEAAGLANYIAKQEWRRYKDRELRAEGHEGLALNRLLGSALQTTPAGSTTPPTVIAGARRGDGKMTIVAGSQTTLWAYTALDDTRYVSNNGVDDYFASGSYVDGTQYGWIQIAGGLSTAGRRWEAVQVGDYLCLNNGVDLPLTYQPGDGQAFPIWELREQQIASVGTIAEHNGNLLCFDLWIINDADFLALMTPVSVTSDTVFTPNPAQYAAFTDATRMQRFPWRCLPSYPGQPRRWGATVPASAKLGDHKLVFQYPVRSLPELVALNNASGLVTTSLAGGSTDITVLYANTGGGTLTTSIIGIQDQIAMSCLIWDQIGNPISFSGDASLISSIEAGDAANSYAGTYVDLIDDGGTIIKALALRDQIVVYKDTPNIYLGTFTGASSGPYNFQRVPIANEAQALAYRNTLMASGGGYYGSCHIYAGRNAFYKWDIFMQTPQEMPEFQPAEDIFFLHAAGDKENAWVAENPLTREWVFGWATGAAAAGAEGALAPGGSPEDRALCVDYAFKTVRTTTAAYNCGARVQHPTRGDWLFLFGDDAGGIQRYGLFDAAPQPSGAITATIAGGTATASAAFFTVDHVGMTLWLATGDLVAISGYTSSTVVSIIGTAPNTGEPPGANGPVTFTVLPGIWHRNGLAYSSLLETGAGDLGSADSEKLVTRYVPVASSQSPNSSLQVDFKAGLNPGAMSFVQTAVVAAPQSGHNLIEPTFIGYHVGGRVIVSGINNPFELVTQIWEATLLASKSAGRI